MPKYLQYGCGFCAPDGWENYDVSWTLRAEQLPLVGRFIQKNERRFPENVRYGDIVSGVLADPGSVHAVWAAHVLEHLSRADFQTAIRNTFAMLEPGGLFRLIVPDLQVRAAMYLDKLRSGDSAANDWFMRTTVLGVEASPATLLSRATRLFGGNLHQWMWDWPSMQGALSAAGFVSIRPAEPGDSGDLMFDLVEAGGGFIGEGTFKELAVHCVKPI